MLCNVYFCTNDCVFNVQVGKEKRDSLKVKQLAITRVLCIAVIAPIKDRIVLVGLQLSPLVLVGLQLSPLWEHPLTIFKRL